MRKLFIDKMRAFMCLSTKTVVLSDAYEMLRCLKHEHEIFSDVIGRVVARKPFSSFAGILTSEEAKRVENVVREHRAQSRRRTVRRIYTANMPTSLCQNLSWLG